jgi:preprotein translocase subunit SecB
MEANKASFSLQGYKFTKIKLDLEDIPSNVTFTLEFNPSGKYIKEKGIYNLVFEFLAYYKKDSEKKDVVFVSCNAEFKFNSNLDFEDIPNFFYPNSIAIIFPYVRALVSTLTLQANAKPIILPTINLFPLQNVLKEHTIIK